VAYELLTGRALFDMPVSDTVALVLTKDADVEAARAISSAAPEMR
jgi:hypothetical protein